jgi:hypothetical protein
MSVYVSFHCFFAHENGIYKMLFEVFTCERKNVFIPSVVTSIEFIISFSIFLKDLFCGRKMNDGSNTCFLNNEYVPSLDLGSNLNSYGLSTVDMLM